MKEIFGYISDYYQSVDKRILLASIFLTAILIYLNYRHGLEKRLCFANGSFTMDFFGHYFIFIMAFGLPYLLCLFFNNTNYFSSSKFVLLVMAAPAVFAFKMALFFRFNFTTNSQWNFYWNRVIYWPLLLFIAASILFILWKLFKNSESFYGLTANHFNWKPYFIMLLLMLPLIGAASTQPDFLITYPKMKTVAETINTSSQPWFYKLLYQLSYGSDFFTIELFFRGFLILGFLSFAGKDAILPMACFYCTIHFGKPLGECISSFFGGLLLGIIVYNTKSIWGGLVIHLGIAWLMEIGGYIGSTIKMK
jgi:hypothetical protein